MRTLIFILPFVFCSALSVVANPNLYHKKRSLKVGTTKSLPVITYTFDTTFAKKFVADFDFEHPSNYPFQDLSDAGVYLTQLGENNKALNVFQWLHEQHGAEYNIVSNLGAAHQLNGNLDSAEYYLLKALHLSPLTVPKEEWVQLKIIAAKRSVQQDPNWLLHHQVLDLNWDTSFYQNNSTNHYNKKQQDSLQIVRYTNYKNQFDTLWSVGNVMQTQIPYIAAPNLLVANIMKELAYYFAVNLSVKDAFVAYKIALHYDPENQLNIQQALTQLMPHFRKYEFDEAIFENKFHPANSSYLDHEKAPVNDETAQASSNNVSPLYWKAGIALLLLIVIFSYSFSNKSKK